MDVYYTDQIMTYMGNKRKVLPHIEPILQRLKEKLGQEHLAIGEGFSGSGVVTRLFKNHASAVYVNDLSGYSKTLSQCYLANPDAGTLALILQYIQAANLYVNSHTPGAPPFVQLHWAPQGATIQAGERAYYTPENGRRIDSYQA